MLGNPTSTFSPDGNIVQTLIALGVDVNAKDENGKTALMYAAERGSIHVVQILLAAGADVNAKAEKWALFRGYLSPISLAVSVTRMRSRQDDR